MFPHGDVDHRWCDPIEELTGTAPPAVPWAHWALDPPCAPPAAQGSSALADDGDHQASKGLWKRFRSRIGGIAALGLVTALLADSPWWPGDSMDPDFADAIREVGGALVAGAVLAGLVVWFEDRREDERVEREIERDDRRDAAADARERLAARRAWQRAIDVRLVGLLRTDVAIGRTRWLRSMRKRRDEAKKPKTSAFVAAPLQLPDTSVPRFWEHVTEAHELVQFLRHERLTDSWERWDGTTDDLDGAPKTADADVVARLMAAETDAWEALLATVDVYIDEEYPTE